MEPQPEKERIRFRPISDGLGFHPFADGLPYAPASRTQLPPPPLSVPGAGQTAMGPLPLAPQPHIEAPSRPRPKTPPTAPREASVAQPVAASGPTQEPLIVSEPRLGLGFMFKRTLAFVMDTVILSSLVSVFGVSAAILMNLDPSALLEPELLSLEIAFGGAFLWSLITAQEVVFSTTLGKRLFDLRVEGSLGSRILRSVFLPASLLLTPLNLIIGLIDRKQRLIHEWCSGSRTIEVAQL